MSDHSLEHALVDSKAPDTNPTTLETEENQQTTGVPLDLAEILNRGEAHANFSCGLIAIVGRPNVGKSSLINAIIGEKVSITSHKAQTTRHHILGIHNAVDAQYVFVDTPGFQTKHQQALNRTLNKTVTGTLSGVDLVLLVVEAKSFKPEDEQILALLPQDIPVILICNKKDLVHDQKQLLPFLQFVSQKHTFAEIIPFSALKAKQDKDIAYLLTVLKPYLPIQPPAYDVENYTTQTQRFVAAEFIREKIFRFTGDELPYQATVVIDQFEEKPKITRIFATILVEKAAHKAMMIGDKGQRIKQISLLARSDMEKTFNTPVYLELWVKVKTGWADDEANLRSYGYHS